MIFAYNETNVKIDGMLMALMAIKDLIHCENML